MTAITLCTSALSLPLIYFLKKKFAINLDGKVWHQVKRPNYPYSQFLKNKEEITLYHPKLYFWLHFAP